MTTAIDSIGGQDGTYSGSWCAQLGLLPGTDHAAKAQDSTSSYVLLPDTAFPCPPLHDWSVSGIVNTGLGTPIIASFEWAGNGEHFIGFAFFDGGPQAGHLILQVPNTSLPFPQVEYIVSANPVPIGTHLFVATFELSSNTFSIYIDGVLEGSEVNPDHEYASATTPTGAWFGFNGAVVASEQATYDEMALYDVCLSAGDVATLEAARSSYATFSATVIGLGATSLYHLTELSPCPGVVFSAGWYVGTIGMGP